MSGGTHNGPWGLRVGLPGELVEYGAVVAGGGRSNHKRPKLTVLES